MVHETLHQIDRANALIERLRDQVCDGDLRQDLRMHALEMHEQAVEARESLRSTLTHALLAT